MQQQRMEPLGLWVLLDLLVRLVPMHHPQDPQVLLAVTEPPEQLDPQERRVLREMEEVLDPQVPLVLTEPPEQPGLLVVTEPPEPLDPQDRRVLREMEEVQDPQVPQVPLVPLAVPAS